MQPQTGVSEVSLVFFELLFLQSPINDVYLFGFFLTMMSFPSVHVMPQHTEEYNRCGWSQKDRGCTEEQPDSHKVDVIRN